MVENNKPLLVCRVLITKHVTTEEPEKNDKFAITGCSPEGALVVGRDSEAELKFTLKTTEEFAKRDFPQQHPFVIKIYDLTTSEQIALEKTEQKRLEEIQGNTTEEEEEEE